jgi:hypothetical protein
MKDDRRLLKLAACSKSLEEIAALFDRKPEIVRKTGARLGIYFDQGRTTKRPKAAQKAKGK